MFLKEFYIDMYIYIYTLLIITGTFFLSFTPVICRGFTFELFSWNDRGVVLQRDYHSKCEACVM